MIRPTAVASIAILMLAAASSSSSFAQRPESNARRTPLTPGQTFKECRNCPEMIVVPAARS